MRLIHGAGPGSWLSDFPDTFSILRLAVLRIFLPVRDLRIERAWQQTCKKLELWLQACLGQSFMLIEDIETLEQLGKIVVRLTSNPALREDLMQEALIHLWQIQEQNPGQTKNWYLQNCRFRLLHYLALGRSVDSPKRRASQVQPVENDDDSDNWLDRLEGSDSVLQHVSARDILTSLAKLLSPREMSILQWLAEGQGTREIAKRLGISHPMVIKHRRKIAALAKKLSIDDPQQAREAASREAAVLH